MKIRDRTWGAPKIETIVLPTIELSRYGTPYQRPIIDDEHAEREEEGVARVRLLAEVHGKIRAGTVEEQDLRLLREEMLATDSPKQFLKLWAKQLPEETLDDLIAGVEQLRKECSDG